MKVGPKSYEFDKLFFSRASDEQAIAIFVKKVNNRCLLSLDEFAKFLNLERFKKLQNECLLAKIGLDATDKEPSEVSFERLNTRMVGVLNGSVRGAYGFRIGGISFQTRICSS